MAIRRRSANEEFSAGNGNDQNYWFDKTVVLASGGRHVRQRTAEQHLQPGPVSVGHRAVQERQCRRTRSFQFRAEIFNFLNHANWNGAEANPTNAQLRPHHRQGRLAPGHPAEPAVPVLGGAVVGRGLQTPPGRA